MLEATVLLFVATLFGYGFSDVIIQRKARRWHHIGIRKGYHFHHSLYGLAMFALTPITFGNIFETLGLIGFGLGIIIEHTIHDSFVFINKINKELEENALAFMNKKNKETHQS